LREFSDRLPPGFAETESAVELEIPKPLFTKEEAALAVRLSPFLDEVGQL